MSKIDSAPAASPASLRRMRRVLLGVLFAIIVLLIFLTAWIGIRGWLAREALDRAVPVVAEVKADIASQSWGAVPGRLTQMHQDTSRAVSLTSDVVWRSLEVVPGLGPNLAAVRHSAHAVDTLARAGSVHSKPLLAAMSSGALLPKSGVVDLDTVRRIAPQTHALASAAAAARHEVDSIDRSSALPPIRGALDELRPLLRRASDLAGDADAAVRLLPGMLGGGGPRNYLVIMQNNAELRSAGGIVGALALVHAENGRVTISAQSSANAMKSFPAPVLTLTSGERTLFTDEFGRYMQNVTRTPDFARTGQLARAMWAKYAGTEVDGVVSVDPVALARLLKVIGPVDAGQGVTLTGDNAVAMLLSQVYQRIPAPADQDVFFAGAARAVFDDLTAGGAKPDRLLSAIGASAGDRRILMWSARPNEQKLIDGTAVRGAAPRSDAATTGIGVYLDDNTEAKMSYYLRAQIAEAAVVCRADRRPYYEIRVRLTSTAPLDAATALPAYVTGTRPGLGIKKGQIMTSVLVYAPPGSQIYDVRVGSESRAFVSASDAGERAAGYPIILDPQQTAVVTFSILGPAGAATAISLQHTPMASAVRTTTGGRLTCPASPATGDSAMGAAPQALAAPGLAPEVGDGIATPLVSWALSPTWGTRTVSGGGRTARHLLRGFPR